MSESFAALRRAVGRDARDLEIFNHRIRQLLGRLPASTSRSEEEDVPDDPEGLDEATALRAALQCTLADHLEPAARNLRSASRRPLRSAGGGPS